MTARTVLFAAAVVLLAVNLTAGVAAWLGWPPGPLMCAAALAGQVLAVRAAWRPRSRKAER